MIKLLDGGAYLVNGEQIIPDTRDAAAQLTQAAGACPSKEEASKNTIAYNILEAHNTSGNMKELQVRFDS